MMCQNCEKPQPKWNDAGYLICMNCGTILIEPVKKNDIIHGLVTYAATVKERLWRLRIADTQGGSPNE